MTTPRPGRSLWSRAPWTRSAWPLLCVLAVLYLPWIHALPLDGTLEGNRLEAAREMRNTGDWLVPHLGGVPYLAKPPLHPWTLAALGMLSGGVTTLLGRLVSAVSALATCWLLWRSLRLRFGRRVAWNAAFVLGSSALVLGKALRAELECELLLWTTSAMLAVQHAVEAGSVPRRRTWALVAGTCLGAALLTKGPPPLIVFASVVVAQSLSPARRRAWLEAGALALLPALALCLAWLVPTIVHLGGDALRDALRVQFTERIVQAGRTNAEPFWYYLPALVGGLAPAILLAPGLWFVRPTRARRPEERARLSFLWTWAVLPCLLFSLSSGKESRYLLPMVPAWAALLALGWRRARREERLVAWWHGLRVGLAWGSWCAPFLWCALGNVLFPAARPAVFLSAGLAFAGRVLVFLAERRARPGLLLLAAGLILVSGKFAWRWTAVEARRRSTPVDEVAHAIRTHLQPQDAWTLIGPYRSWWEFAAERSCHAVSDGASLDADAHLVLAPHGQLASLPAGFTELGRWEVAGEEFHLLTR